MQKFNLYILITVMLGLVLFSCSGSAMVVDRYEVYCPPIGPIRNISVLSSMTYTKTTKYCECNLVLATKKHRTAIIKCDFNFEKDIELSDHLFPFASYNVTSAYVRISNALSAFVRSSFLMSWMKSPSSALDLWHCGFLTLQPTPEMEVAHKFIDYNTFVGVGMIDCKVPKIPSKFLRDRTRGALRLKDCDIGVMESGVISNVAEMRYLVMEDCHIERMKGPLSSSGIIQLSKKQIHSWEGLRMFNVSIDYLQQGAIHVTHKSDMEDFVMEMCNLGNVSTKAISASGDLAITISNNTFGSLAEKTFQIKVTGKITFSHNVIESALPDTFTSFTCDVKVPSIFTNNYLKVSNEISDEKTEFGTGCQDPNLKYIMAKPNSPTSIGVIVGGSIGGFLLLFVLVGLGWLWRSRVMLQVRYLRGDSLITRDDGI